MNTYYNYTVKGETRFPLDMLRHDQAHPTTRRAIRNMASAREHNYGISSKCLYIRLASPKKPTVKRWESFGWTVYKIHLVVELEGVNT